MNPWRDLIEQAQALPGGRWRLAGLLLAFAFPVLALVVDKAASTIFAIFFLAGLWFLARGRFERPDRAIRWVLIAFAAYFLVGTLSFFLGEQTRLGEQLLGRDIRFLGAVAVFFALARLAMPERLLRVAFVTGGVVTGMIAIIEVIAASHPDYRAGGETISIVFGHLAVLLFAVNLAIVLFSKKGRLAALPGVVFALAAVTLSSTRGALLSALAVLAAGIAIAVLLDREWRRPARLVGIAGAGLAALVVAGWVLLPRFEDGIEEFRAYMAMAATAETGAARECLDREALERRLQSSERRGVIAEVIARDLAVEGCSTGSAIRLRNASGETGYWIGAYRNLPAGAAGRIRVQGRAQVKLEGGNEWRNVDAPQPRAIALPRTRKADRTRLVVRVAPGEQVLLVPVVTRPGEYAFPAADTPVGSRLAMWAAALRQIDASPLGRGAGSWPVIMEAGAVAGRVPWRLSTYDHAHSDYLTVLVERGWLGLLALIGVLVAPLAWGARTARRAGGWREPALMLLVTSVAVSALTETVFNHSIGITYYCALVLLLLTAREKPVS